VPGSLHIAGVGDFDGNHHDDVLWRDDNGAVWIWDNGQIANAHNVAAAGVVPAGWQIAGIGDFGGNGRDDILWQPRRRQGGIDGRKTYDPKQLFRGIVADLLCSRKNILSVLFINSSTLYLRDGKPLV